MSEKYINPFTDFGFKRIFGEEANKDLLIDFLNQLLSAEEGLIKSIKYMNPEKSGASLYERKAVFDIYCENERGEKFIVEMQKAKQKFFKDRSLFYSTFPIREQAEKGDWDFELKKVYLIAILDFEFDEDKDEKDKFIYNVKLSDIETKKVFYDKLTFIYIEIPKFQKTIDEVETHFDKWLYVLKNLNFFEKIPSKIKEKIFKKLFIQAEIAKLSVDEQKNYQESLKNYRDLKNVIDTAKEESFNEGKLEGKREIAKNALQQGLSVEIIQSLTGLSIEEIKNLENKNNS